MKPVKKKFRVQHLFIGFIILIGICHLSSCSTLSLKFTAGELNEKLEKEFPVTQSYFQVFSFTLANPRVRLEPNSTVIKLNLDADLSSPLIQGGSATRGTLLVSTEISYDPETKNLILTNCQLESVQFDGLPDLYALKIRAALNEIAKDYINAIPIHTLASGASSKTAAKNLVKNVAIQNETLIVTLGF